MKVKCKCPCGKEFYLVPSRVKSGRGKFCSIKCKYTYSSPDPSTLIKKGEHRNPAGEFSAEMVGGKNNCRWAGDNIGYSGVHTWLREKFGFPRQCELCGFESENTHQFHWHNISGEYKRDRNDFIRLCAKCHKAEHKNMTTIPVRRIYANCSRS